MKHVNLRLEDDLHSRIKEAAEGDHRSLQGQIVALLESGLEARSRNAELEVAARAGLLSLRRKR